MIIKKPYAFIIKYFRYIHALLCLLLIYISYKNFAIFKFFNDYVKSGYYTYYEKLSNHFINIYIFIAIIIVIIISVGLYYVMKVKEKNRKYYIYTCIFYLVLFIWTIYIFNIFKTIEIKSIDIRSIRSIRDILIVTTLPQLFFSIFSLFRALGFDIKSFNFKKDLEELNISEEDSEIVEILLPNDSYKHMRKLRRFIRETKYFAVEYKFVFLVIILTITVGLVLTLYLNFSVYNKKYKESDEFLANSIKYSVIDSILTTVDYSGITINENKKYVIVVLKVKNMDINKKSINLENLRLVVNDELYFPMTSKKNYFVDIGQTYTKQSLIPEKEYEYLIIYELPKNLKTEKYTFSIFTDVSEGEINSKNKNVDIYPRQSDSLELSGNYKINEKILLGESNLEKSSFKVKSYELNKLFDEKFNYCVEEMCYQGIKRFIPSIISNTPKVIIKLECDYEPDESKYIKKEVSAASSFVSYFGSIYYSLENYAKTISIKVLTSDLINKNKVFIEVPVEVNDAKTIDLFITIRNIRYIITLK